MRPPTRTQAPTSFIRKWPRERRQRRGPYEIVKTFTVSALEYNAYEAGAITGLQALNGCPAGFYIAGRQQVKDLLAGRIGMVVTYHRAVKTTKPTH